MTHNVEPLDTAVRERLLAASLELFTSKGYAATSVREIVAAARVTKPVLYYYFGSKEGIYLELMNSTYATFQGIVSQLGSASGTVQDRVIGFATSIFDGFVANIEVVRLIYSIYFGPPQGAPFFPHDQYFNEMLQIIGGMLREGICKGELKPVNVEVTTWAMMSALNTVMEEQLCRKEPRIDRSGLIDIINMIFQGISGEKQ